MLPEHWITSRSSQALCNLRADRRCANALDGRDGAIAHRADRQHAGAHCLAVDMRRTRSALSNAAAVMPNTSRSTQSSGMPAGASNDFCSPLIVNLTMG
jgi:hypothetical protein